MTLTVAVLLNLTGNLQNLLFLIIILITVSNVLSHQDPGTRI